jgi:hypothetical protein
MIVIPANSEKFDEKLCRKLFNKYRDVLDVDDFDTVLDTTHFFSFYDDNQKFIGCIYFYMHNDKLFITAYAGRGHHEINLECLRESLGWYNCDIYAEKVQPAARLAILKCGFKKVGKDLYVYRRKNNG